MSKNGLYIRQQLREIDIILKNKNIGLSQARLTELQHIEPMVSEYQYMINDYLMMLQAWQNGEAVEVKREFMEYGFRRAQAVAYQEKCVSKKVKIAARYQMCVRVMQAMNERFKSSVEDKEEEMFPGSEVQVLTLEEAGKEIEQGELL